MISFIQGIQVSRYSFVHNGSPISCGSEQLDVTEAEMSSGLVLVRAYHRLLGGKGGEKRDVA